MKRAKVAPRPIRELDRGELAQVTGGSDVAGIFKLKQHVDNPGQTP